MICSSKCTSLDIIIIFVYGLQVPADNVDNAMLCIISYHPRGQLGLIYHIDSSMRNPLEIGELLHTMFRYLMEKPFVGAMGEVIKVNQLIVPATMDCYEHMDRHYKVLCRFVFNRVKCTILKACLVGRELKQIEGD